MAGKAKRNDVLTRFGDRLRSLRTDQGHSQEDLADLCDLDRTYISGIERGKRNVSLRNLEVIANAFELSLAELLDGVG